MLIRRTGEQSVLRGLGVRAIDPGDSGYRMIPNKGTVIGVCRETSFLLDEYRRLKDSNADRRAINQVAIRSSKYDYDIEVKPGDEVVFRYVHNWENEDDVDEETIAIDYESLICKIENGVVYPLAGNVLIKDTRHDDDRHLTKVLAAGKPLKRYFDFPGFDDGEIDVSPGDDVAVNIKQSIPVQDPDLGASIDEILGETNIAAIKRRYILFKFAQS